MKISKDSSLKLSKDSSLNIGNADQKTIPIYISHKGCGNDPNTIDSVRQAMNGPYHGVEIDVLCTRDQILVLGHDDDLFERTGHTGRISDILYSDLCNRRTRHGHKIPSLSETLDFIENQSPGYLVVIDPKSLNAFYQCKSFFSIPQTGNISSTKNLEIILGHPVMTLNWKCINIYGDKEYYKPPWYLQILLQYPNALIWTVNDPNIQSVINKYCVGIISDSLPQSH